MAYQDYSLIRNESKNAIIQSIINCKNVMGVTKVNQSKCFWKYAN